MIKPILTDKKLLSKVCEEIDTSYENYEVVKDLLDTARTLNNCAGLAAPQIGHFKRVILVNVQGKALVMINPEVISLKGKNTFGIEACFSVPSSMQHPKRVKRFFKIKVVYWTEEGDLVEELFKGFEARLIQHEIDHLEGKLI